MALRSTWEAKNGNACLQSQHSGGRGRKIPGVQTMAGLHNEVRVQLWLHSKTVFKVKHTESRMKEGKGGKMKGERKQGREGRRRGFLDVNI